MAERVDSAELKARAAGLAHSEPMRISRRIVAEHLRFRTGPEPLALVFDKQVLFDV